MEDENQDPLLFVPLADGKFYLVHQWGNDLAWYRRIIAWPLRSFTTFALSIVFFNVLVSLIIPGSLISESGNFFSIYRFILFIYLLLSSSAVLSYIWFATNQKLSSQAWSSKSFN